jgi:hypothetical protein
VRAHIADAWHSSILTRAMLVAATAGALFTAGFQGPML